MKSTHIILVLDILFLFYISYIYFTPKKTKNKKINKHIISSNNSNTSASISASASASASAISSAKKEFSRTPFYEPSHLLKNNTPVTSQESNNVLYKSQLDEKINFVECSVVDALKLKNVFFRIQSQINSKNILKHVDDLQSQFLADGKKRLIIVPYQKDFVSYHYYFLSDLKEYFKNNICLNIFENLDLLPQFPRITSMFAGSFLEWTNSLLNQYHEIYFMLDVKDYDLWKQIPSVDIEPQKSLFNVLPTVPKEKSSPLEINS